MTRTISSGDRKNEKEKFQREENRTSRTEVAEDDSMNKLGSNGRIIKRQ